MCYQVVELYSICRCLYYQHPVDRCATYGRHSIQRKTVLVGYACSNHSEYSDPGHSFSYSIEYNRPSDPRRGNGYRLTAVPDTDGVRFDLLLNNSVDSGESYNSDNSSESHKSSQLDVVSVSTSGTTIDGDTVELLFSKLVHFGDLRFLWPQLIARSSSWKRSHRTIERLIRRYSQDLEKLATNSISNESITYTERAMRIRASKFIRRFRVQLAQRICESHYGGSEQRSGENENEKPKERDTWYNPVANATEDSDSGDDDESLFILEAAETFLFRTEPILYLQANVKALVKFRAPEITSLTGGIWSNVKLQFENIVFGNYWNIKPASNCTRLCWTCVSIRCVWEG